MAVHSFPNVPVATGSASESVPSRVAPIGLPDSAMETVQGKKKKSWGRNTFQLAATAQSTTSESASRSRRQATLHGNTEKREFDVRNDNFMSLQELGSGNGGRTSVMKVQHVETGTLMAKKVVLSDANPAERKKILLELQTIHTCNSPFIVSSYGAYLMEPNICMWMEFMDKGSFAAIYKRIGPIDLKVVGKVAVAVLQGLRYLYEEHRIIHGDIKPSNILCNSTGDIKLCDFGVSGKFMDPIANTFVGTSTYFSPERIKGATHSVKSDIWSLGITLIELIVGQFPFSGSSDSDNESDLECEGERTRRVNHRTSLAIPSGAKRRSRRRIKGVSLHGGGMTISIVELMHQIINEPAPRLPPRKFGSDAEEFVDACLEKDGERRMGLEDLFKLPWITYSRKNGVDVAAWTKTF
ncbi:kinase [Mycena amicta]|nr:kinase [Mycena amicta]